MITVYFEDGSYKKVTAVEGQKLVKTGKASYTPYIQTTTFEVSDTVEAPEIEEENLIESDPEEPIEKSKYSFFSKKDHQE